MNILVFIYSLHAGGAERVTTNLVNAWAERDWKVTLVTWTSTSSDFYSLHPKIRRVALNLADESNSCFRGMLANIKRIYALRCLLLQLQPNIALGMMPRSGVLTILARFSLSVRSIASERIHPPMLPESGVWEWLRRIVYPYASCIVMQTDESRRWLEQHIPKAKTAVIPNPVTLPLPSGEPRLLPQQWLADSRKLLLAVGRLEHQKGFDLLLSAFASLATTCPDWDLVILGEGSERAALEAQRAQLGLGSRAHLPGRAGNMPDWYQRADLYVMSSRFEGFPNTLMEAMAYGCAGVSYDCNTGPRELIRDGLDGVLVRPVGDTRALASALLQLMQRDSLRQDIAKRAAVVRERYTMAQILAQWDKLFHEVMCVATY